MGRIKVDNTRSNKETYLKLFVHKDCQSIDTTDIVKNQGCRTYVTIGKKEYCVIVNPHATIEGEEQYFIVNSVKYKGAEYTNVFRMTDKLGLDEAKTSIEITEISENPIEPKVGSPANYQVQLTASSLQQHFAGSGQSVPKADNSRLPSL